ncbi:unnamed protein product [Rotaria magnacalcarata]
MVNYIQLWCFEWLRNGYELNCIWIYRLHSRIYQKESICKCVFTSINSNNVISFQIVNIKLYKGATKGEKADPQDPQSHEIPWGSKGSNKNPGIPRGSENPMGIPK